ncbi:MAG: hypothetical protein QOG85_380 [Gaiellaceae bacterium]|jgi:CheY-like chemotaxis protein|nr:hypothetical protein [Gaiellaceae bacterium]
MSSAADLLRAVAGLAWVGLAILVVLALRSLLRGERGALTKLGFGLSGVTVEFADAKLSQATSNEQRENGSAAIGRAARRSVIDRLRTHSDLLGRARILWVDDHPENNAPLIDLLREFGATVDTPRSNADALALLRGSDYDVVISDVARDDEAPKGELKGVELAREVFDRWGRQVLLFTARFEPTQLPGASAEERLALVSDVRETVFATTNRADEALHYIMDLLER